MEIQRDEAFEEAYSKICKPIIARPYPRNEKGEYFYKEIHDAHLMWQAAQAVPEGFVLVPEEPYAYLIKHKLWNKNSQPEIYLADDFVGNDGVEKEKLIVCIPLYKGEDEAQEQNHE